MAASIYPLDFLYDGNCRICRFDVVRLQRADRADGACSLPGWRQP